MGTTDTGDSKFLRRFSVQEIDNGFLVKITEAGSDKFVGQYAFYTRKELFDWLSEKFAGRGVA